MGSLDGANGRGVEGGRVLRISAAGLAAILLVVTAIDGYSKEDAPSVLEQYSRQMAELAGQGVGGGESYQSDAAETASLWGAEEGLMGLDVDSVRRTTAGARGRSLRTGKTGGLAFPLYFIREEEKELRDKVAALDNESNLYRTKAHLLRMQAGAEILTASKELQRVASLDHQMGSIRADAKTSKLSFLGAAKKIRREGENMQKLRAKAAAMLAKVKSLKSKAEGYDKLSDVDKHAAMMSKDQADKERELVSRYTVRKDRQGKSVQALESSLAKLESKYEGAKQKRATTVKAADEAEERAKERAHDAEAAFKKSTSAADKHAVTERVKESAK